MGCFSVTSDRFYEHNFKELKYMEVPPLSSFPLKLDEVAGAQDLKPNCSFFDEYLDHMLNYITDSSDEMLLRQPKKGFFVNANIVCQAEVLEVLMSTPYKWVGRNWKILATKYRSTIYLCLGEHQGAHDDYQAVRRFDLWEAKLRHHLYRGERIALRNHLKKSASCAEFNCVFRCNLNGLLLVYSSPMCGTDIKFEKWTSESKPTSIDVSKMNFIEAKLGLTFIGPTQHSPKQTLSWWSACTLKGIRNVHVASADLNGQVEKLEIQYLGKIVVEHSEFWAPDVSKHYLSYTLQAMKIFIDKTKIDNASAVFEFDYSANSEVLSCVVHSKRNKHTFLSDWYRMKLEDNECVY
ncbi:protein cutoff-like [Scaptodrosophila lebanonensis]|uniref:Decapping nuclease n=1 Tax=Drosophila lebanonensis TaxID=7225 RepID=A0A6J2TKP7_DROLE|nr:protein cutoff-like [Scaptodrosophila lebanonensis]